MGAWKKRDCLAHDLLFVCVALLNALGIPLMVILWLLGLYWILVAFFVFWLPVCLLTRAGGPYDLHVTYYEDLDTK